MIKYIFIIFTFLFGSVNAFSQCNSFQTDSIDCGDTINYSFYTELITTDFNQGVSSWAYTSGTMFTNPYIPSPTNDTYFWMGISSTVPTSLTTTPLNVSSGGQICFDFVYAVQGQPSPTEGPDQYNEGISLQYDSAGVWNDIVYYAPNGDTLPANPGVDVPNVSSGVTSFTSWTSVCVDIPSGAFSDSTSFRWIQTNTSSYNNDHWGLDNIVISSSTDTSYNIYLENGPNSYTLLGNLQQDVDSVFTEDAYLNFMITNNVDTCYAAKEVFIRSLDLGPDLIFDCVQNGLEIEIENVNPNSSFSWSPTSYITGANTLNPIFDPLQDTEYIFSSQCGVDTINMDVINNFIINVPNDTAICVGDSLDLNVLGGGQTFSWVPNNSTINNINISNPTVYPSYTTSYIVTADSAGCSKTKEIEVQVSNLQFLLVLVSDANCLNGTNGQVVAPAGNGVDTTYYSLFDGVNTVVSDIASFINLADGNYTLTAHDALSCPIDTGFTITGGPAIVDTAIITSTTFSCNGTGLSTLELITSNSNNATFSINNGPHSNSNVFTGLTDGTYFIEIINDFCTSNESFLISNPSINLSYNSLVQVSCYNGTNGQVLLDVNNGTGPFQYSIDNINFQDSALFDSLSAGIQTFYVMDANGCSDSLTLNINQGSQISLGNIAFSNVLCNGEEGLISFDAIGGQGPYAYSIDSGSNFTSLNNFNNIVAGTYQLQISDDLNCLSDTLDITIQENTAIIIDSVSFSNIECGGIQNGSIYFNAIGGQGPYMYSIDSGANFSNSNYFSNLSAGFYTLLCIDIYGCFSDTSYITITEPAPLLLNTVNLVSPSCGQQDGIIEVLATGGTNQYQYSLNNGVSQSNGIFNLLGSGSYLLSVVDSVGCSVNTAIQLNNTNAPVLSVSNIDSITCYGLNDGKVELSVTNAISSLIFSVNNVATQTDSVFDNLSAGIYDFMVEDTFGCQSFANVELFQPDSLSLVVGSTLDTNNTSTGTAFVMVSGGVSPYSYLWDDNLAQTSQTAIGLESGSYTVMVTDNNFCSKSKEVIVGVFNAIGELYLEHFELFPNPSLGNFVLQFNASSHIDYELSIINLVGKEVFSKELKSKNGFFNESIYLNDTPSSIYFVVITDGINKRVEKLVILD